MLTLIASDVSDLTSGPVKLIAVKVAPLTRFLEVALRTDEVAGSAPLVSEAAILPYPLQIICIVHI